MKNNNEIRCPRCGRMLYRDKHGYKTIVVDLTYNPDAYIEKDVKCQRCGESYGLVFSKEKLSA